MIDSLIIIGLTSTSITLSLSAFGLIVRPITAGVGCGLTFGTKLASEFSKKNTNISYKNTHFQITLFKIFEKCIEKLRIKKMEYKNILICISSIKPKGENQAFSYVEFFQ